MRKDIVIMVSVTAVIIGIVGVLVVFNNPQNPVVVSDIFKLVRADSHATGSASAKVTLVEFGDYQCPACGAAQSAVRGILVAYKDNPDFSFVFRNFPLQQHQNAMTAAEAAEAAGAQGKYWQMNDLLYDKQEEWSSSDKPLDVFAGYAQQLGLDVNKFKQEVRAEKYKELINKDAQDGADVGVNSTPTFYLNGKQSVGVPLINGLKEKIDTELSK